MVNLETQKEKYQLVMGLLTKLPQYSGVGLRSKEAGISKRVKPGRWGRVTKYKTP